MALSAAAGPLAGGQITAAVGFRGVFAVNLVLLPISALLAGAPARSQTAAPKRAPFDVGGTLLLGAALGALVLGVGRGGGTDGRLLAASASSFVALAWIERRAQAPIVDVTLLRRPVFVTSGLLIATQNLAMYALFELPAIAGIVLDADASSAGRLLVFVMAPMVVCSPLAGRLADSFGARRVAVAGAASALAGMVLLLATPLSSLAAPIPALLLVGAGFGLSGSPAQAAGMSAIPAEESGAAAGLMSTLRDLGGVAGTLVLGLVLPSTRERALVLSAHHAALRAFVVALACAFALPGSARPRVPR